MPFGGLMPSSIGLALGLCSLLAGRRHAHAVVPSSSPPARFIRIPSFMGVARAADILHGTALRSFDLQPSTVTGKIANYRSSQLLWRGDEIAPDVTERVRMLTPWAIQVLRIDPFAPGEIETQVTVSGNGDFFKRHDDNGSPDTATRRLSWVYYVHREPRPFVGGELVMYGARHPNGGDAGAYLIEPENDSLILFPADVHHEVREVVTPSASPYDARVTVNGWVRAA